MEVYIMPLLNKSDYNAPFLFENGHVQTIFSSLLRRLDTELRRFDTDFYFRERIYTDDDDFLDLDWSKKGNRKLGIVSHGLEGNSHRAYVVGMVKALNQNGWDALAWNYRSCSGEINRQLRFYHSGSIDDLDLVIKHAIRQNVYKKIALIGFSMGGSLTLTYLGKKGKRLDSRIKKSVVFSVLCNLSEGAKQLARPQCKIYMKRFLRMLRKKVRAKMELMPEKINDHDFHLLKNFKDYDDRYTAPVHGFKNAEDYWNKCSSAQFIPEIKIPVLIVNALNDPFLADGCYPVKEASESKYVYLERPESGGHIGFIQFNKDKTFWSERRAMEFLDNCITF